jgi:hypothetical protein
MTAPTVDETTDVDVDFELEPTCVLRILDYPGQAPAAKPPCGKPATAVGRASCCGKTVLSCGEHLNMYVKGKPYYCVRCHVMAFIKWVRL